MHDNEPQRMRCSSCTIDAVACGSTCDVGHERLTDCTPVTALITRNADPWCHSWHHGKRQGDAMTCMWLFPALRAAMTADRLDARLSRG